MKSGGGVRSGESTHLPLMLPRFAFQTRGDVLVEFVGSLLCSERFFPWFSGFPLSLKTYISWGFIGVYCNLPCSQLAYPLR